MRKVMIVLAALAELAASSPAEAKGCIKGALIGGIAGHYAGHHAVVGALAGCVIGRHAAEQERRRKLPPRDSQRPVR